MSRYFQYSGMQDLKEAHQKLVNLYSDRINADYRLSDKIVEKISNAKKAVRVAEDIITTIDSHSSDSERKRITKGIIDYKRKIESL